MTEREKAHHLAQGMVELLHRMDNLHQHLRDIVEDARALRQEAHQASFSNEEGELQRVFAALEHAGTELVAAHRSTLAAVDRARNRGPHRGEDAPKGGWTKAQEEQEP